MSISNIAGRGALWQISGGGIQALIRLFSSMLLARQLDPIDFGIFGMAHIIYGVFELLSANGFTSGIITKTNINEEDLSTCYWSVMSFRVFLFLILMFIAPYLAIYMNNESLTNTIRAVSLLIIFTGLGAVSQSLMVKSLQFKQISIIKLIGNVVESGLAVTLALTTNLGYWALVVSMLFGIAIINIALILYAKWYPKLIFNKECFRYQFRFGINNMGTSITAYLSHNFDYIIVAKLLGAKMLGYYEFAYRIPHLINEKISGPVGAVAFPALASVKDDDIKISAGYFIASKYVALVILPALAGLALLAPLVVNFLWGEKWIVIVVPLQILCVSAAINGLLDFSKNIFLCKNRPDIPFKFELATLFIAVLSVSILGSLYGLNGVAIGMVLARASSVFSCYSALKMINSSLDQLVKSLSSPFFSTIIMMIFVYLSIFTMEMFYIHKFAQMGIAMIVGIVSYIITIRLLFKGDYFEIIHKVKEMLFGHFTKV